MSNINLTLNKQQLVAILGAITAVLVNEEDKLCEGCYANIKALGHQIWLALKEDATDIDLVHTYNDHHGNADTSAPESSSVH